MWLGKELQRATALSQSPQILKGSQVRFSKAVHFWLRISLDSDLGFFNYWLGISSDLVRLLKQVHLWWHDKLSHNKKKTLSFYLRITFKIQWSKLAYQGTVDLHSFFFLKWFLWWKFWHFNFESVALECILEMLSV